jgi:hypothetical protein
MNVSQDGSSGVGVSVVTAVRGAEAEQALV